MKMRVNSEQQEILLAWLEKNPELASGGYKASHGRVGLERQWKTIAQKLNKHGSSRDADRWQRVWRDWKSNTRKKINKCKHSDWSSLTPYERRIMTLMGAEPNLVSTDGDTSHSFLDIEVKGEPVEKHNSEDSDSSQSEMECSWELPSPAVPAAADPSGADPLRGRSKHRRHDLTSPASLARERRRLQRARRQLEEERARLRTADRLAHVLTRLADLADRLEHRFFDKDNNIGG